LYFQIYHFLFCTKLKLFAGNSISDPTDELMATSRLQEFALHYGFLALAATRLALCFTDAPRLLKQDHLVSSPLTSFSNRASYAYVYSLASNRN